MLLEKPLSVLKAKYQAKAFNAKNLSPPPPHLKGATALLWLYQITGDGVNKAKPVGYLLQEGADKPVLIRSSLG